MKQLFSSLRLSIRRRLARFTAKLALRSFEWMLARQLKPVPVRASRPMQTGRPGYTLDGEYRRIDRY